MLDVARAYVNARWRRGFVCSARNSWPRSADTACSEGLVHSWPLDRGASQSERGRPSSQTEDEPNWARLA